ncbi:hypothetical protein TWF694_009617 [Orbilia ellipsospora]|uniref:Endonuclease/exonuclease/phosphatase domain-containing protein n=1 Tax=Orbilia ellipsospora TaxID=2528407 RepID=A0AAV9XEF2_9PEZI
MRLFSIASTALSVLFFFQTHPALAAPAAVDNSLYVTNGEPLTLGYSTSSPDPKNWVGLYPLGGGPVNGVKPSENSLVWNYTPDSKGTIHLDVGNLVPGNYLAYFLARDGYQSIVKPITVTVKSTLPFAFIVDSITLRTARVGSSYNAKIGGLVNGGTGVTFAITSQVDGWSDWINLSSDGVFSGFPVPGFGRTEATYTVTARSSDGATANLKVTIPVQNIGVPLLSQLRVLTFNMWNGGANVRDSHNKQVRFIANINADVVGLQEADSSAKPLADALGWTYWQRISDIAIISKYPIVQDYGVANAGGGVRIALDGESQQINFWDLHLGYDPYGPYDFCDSKMSIDAVLKREAQSGRTQQITDILKAMSGQLTDSATSKIPVFLVGDTNAPSHLDWVESLRAKNCGYSGVPWPTSVKPAQAGLIDSFRVAHPDPAAVQGTTWSPLCPNDECRPGTKEPQDRIDFIYHKGNVKVLDSQVVVVGKPKPKGDPQQPNNEWTTDHATVLTVYQI